VNALTIKGFVRIAIVASLVSGAGITWCSVTELKRDPWWAAPICFGSIEIGLLVAACFYLVQLAKHMRRLHLDSQGMLPEEVVRMECFCCHFRTGRAPKFWEAVGGKLLLTSHRLAFLAHRGQPWHYRLFLPLEQIAKADSCPLIWGIQGCMRVTTLAGKQELFNFGAIHEELEAERWAAAILQARYRANPDWGSDN
jgi:hypothetical protein